MIVTTTPAVEGRKIVAYKGIVFGEVVSGVNFIKDMFSSITMKRNCRKHVKKRWRKCLSAPLNWAPMP